MSSKSHDVKQESVHPPRIALVCEHGGHLTEILQLLEAFEGCDYFFITNKSPRTSELRYRKYLIDPIRGNPLKVARAVFDVMRILRNERPNFLISTGAEIAIPAFAAARLVGSIRTVYIESWCRVTSPSVSGRLVYFMSDLFLVQWPGLLNRYGRRAMYAGAVI
jgi:UDP-N-acetylglucosamine:LPS N-acetylglucosamine transferase